MFFNRFSYFILFVASLSFLLWGCKKEEGPVTPPADHFEPEGILLLAGADTVVYYFQGAVRPGDTIKAPANNALSPHFSLNFLDDQQQIIQPPSTATHSLGWTIAHNNIAEVYRDPGDEWDFHIRGKDSGTTTIVLRVLHGSHSDFATQPIPIHVSPGFVGEAAGVLVIDEASGDTLAIATSQQVTGSFTVMVDDTTEHAVVYFLDGENIRFQPPAPPHSMGYTIVDTMVVQFIPAGTAEPWAFQLRGLMADTTMIRFKLLHEGDEEFVSPDIQVIVLP